MLTVKSDHYWILKVTGWTVLWAWLVMPARRAVIHADLWRATRCAQQMIRLGRRFGLRLEILPLDLPFDAKDTRGLGLMYQASEDLASACDQFSEKYWRSSDARARQILTTYLRGYLEGHIHFIVFCLEAIRLPKANGKHCIVVPPSFANQLLIDFYAARNDVTISAQREGARFLRQRSAPILAVLAVIWLRMFPRKVLASRPAQNPAVWIEYSGGGRHELNFWCKHVNDSSFDIFYYLDRVDTPLSGEVASHINQSGLNWIDMHELDVVSAAHLPLPLTSCLLRGCLTEGGGRPLWFRSFEFQMSFWTECYARIFTKFKVKALLPHQDRGWRQGVQSIALERAGGIMLGFHWSNMVYDIKNWILLTQHVYFVWGSATGECLQRQGNSFRHTLPSGMWLQETPGSNLDAIEELSKKHRFLIAIYDSNVGDSLRQSPTLSPTSFAEFLRQIVSLIQSNPHIGAMLKFKGETLKYYADILPRGAAIVADLENLKTQGRLVELSCSLSPVTVSDYCDLAVCYPFNSAGIVAGICGSRAVHWDAVGIRYHLYDDPSQKILFRSLDDLAVAVVAASRGDAGVGDFSKWRKYYNHFDDRSGGERIAWFVATYMSSLREQASPDAATDAAAVAYLRHFGETVG